MAAVKTVSSLAPECVYVIFNQCLTEESHDLH